MTHVVFNEADVAVMKKAIEIDPALQGEVVQVKDDLAVGPITDLFTAEGRQHRNQWWREVLSGGDYDGKVDDGTIDDDALVARLVNMLNSDLSLQLWIWVAPNKHDLSGYYWLISQLKAFQDRIFILFLNNLPFINEKGQIFYPEWLHTIPPREFSKAKKLARPVTASEFELDSDEWLRLCAEGKGVRIADGGKKLQQFDYDFYDADLQKYITSDWQKAGKIIHHFLHKNKHTTGDAYLLWRLKGVIAGNDFDVNGPLKGMKDFEVKVKQMQPAENDGA